MILLFVALQAPPEIPALVERLRSDGVEEREEAARRLTELGEAARPALETALKSGDADLRGRAEAVLAEIGRRARIRFFRPATERISVELREAPFPEALSQVLHPFGLTDPSWPAEFASRKVTLTLKDAAFWEALDALCAASKTRLRGLTRAQTLHFRDAAEPEVAVPVHSQGEVRLFANDSGWHSSNDPPRTRSLALWVALPPRCFAGSWSLEELTVTDAKGQTLECKGRMREAGNRDPGGVTRFRVWDARIPRDVIREAGALRLKGTLILNVPKDVERLPFELESTKLPVSLTLDDARVVLQQARLRESTWEFDFKAEGGGRFVPFLAATESRTGSWLFDSGFHLIRPGVSVSSSHSAGGTTRRPDRLVLHRIVAEERVAIPFVLDPVSLPPTPDED